MSPIKTYLFYSFVNRVIDGDTFEATADLGFNVSTKLIFRVKKYDAPEVTRPKTKKEAALGAKAKSRAIELLQGKYVLIQSYKEAAYNRWEAVITLPDGSDFATIMTNEGYVKDGK